MNKLINTPGDAVSEMLMGYLSLYPKMYKKVQGTLGIMLKQDLDRVPILIGEGSGSSLIPVAIARKAAKIGAQILHIGSNPVNAISDITTLMVRIPVRTKEYQVDEISSLQPMTSLFEQSVLLFGDCICKMIIDELQLDLGELWKHHANLE